MTQKIINRGSFAGDGQGENAYTGFGKVNDNFTELYNASPTGGANAQAIFYATTYGAVFDGSTDDTTAINNCLAAARTQYNTGTFNAAAIVFPARASGRTTGTINATGFNNEGKNVTIYANGAMIYLNGNAVVPVWDMMGSKNMHIKDLSLYASSGFQTYGLQCGRIDTISQEGRQNTFEHVNISGSYTQAAAYNFGGEDNIWIDMFAQNTNSGSGYGFVQDGENHFNITSAFVTQTLGVDTPVSFNGNTVIGGKFGSTAAGYTPIWLQGTTGHHFIDAYAANAGPAGTEACITLFHIARVGVYGNHRGLHFLGMHCEANGNPRFYIVHDGPGSGGPNFTATPIISGLEITEPYLSTSTAVFHRLASSGITAITYEDLKLDIAAGPVGGSARVFGGTYPPDVIAGAYVHTYKVNLWDGPTSGVALNIAGNMTFGGQNNLYQWGVPVILPSSGSMANNGAITLTTALPAVYANCYLYLPANALSAGSAPGVYYAQMSSTTVGIVYNNVLSSGAPGIIASPTAFVTTGPGAYTQTTASDLTLATLPIGAGIMGINGSLVVDLSGQRPANVNTVNLQAKYAGVAVGLITVAGSNQWYGLHRTIRNLAAANVQAVLNPAVSNATDTVVSTNAVTYTAIDTSVAANFVINANLVTAATDYFVLFGGTLSASYAP